MDNILDWGKFMIEFGVLMAIVCLIRQLNWIFRSFVATVIFGGALYIATVYADTFTTQWRNILGGILIYTLILAPDTSEDNNVTSKDVDSIRTEIDYQVKELHEELKKIKEQMIVSKTLTPSRHKEHSELEEECESLRVEITSLRADFERLKKNENVEQELWSHEAELKSLRHELEELRTCST